MDATSTVSAYVSTLNMMFDTFRNHVPYDFYALAMYAAAAGVTVGVLGKLIKWFGNGGTGGS